MQARKADHTFAWSMINRPLIYYPGERTYIMDVATITTLISSVGFPIVACIACGLYIAKTQGKMTDAVNNNTAALIKLIEKIDNGNKD